MRKVSIVVGLLSVCCTTGAVAQGFLEKAKQKAREKVTGSADSKQTDAADKKPAAAAAIASEGSSDVHYDDPSSMGKVVFEHVNDNGMDVLYPQVIGATAPNGQLEVQIAYTDLYTYSGGQLKKTGGNPWTQSHDIFINAEADGRAVDFAANDNAAFMTKKGNTVMGGKPGAYTFTFKGKTFATYMMCMAERHNSDSSVLLVGGMVSSGKYAFNTSLGQKVELPKLSMMYYISPDGSHSAAMIQEAAGAGATFYITDAPAPVPMSSAGSRDLWLHNSGTVFSVDPHNEMALLANDKPYHTFEDPIDTKGLFISKDAKRMAWRTPYKGFHFSDGKVYYVTSADRITINGKETLVFIAMYKGTAYLCQKEL